MGTRRAPVDAKLELRLVVPGAASIPVPAGLRYDQSDPYAVQITFHTEVASVAWTFARQLLTDGVSAPAGEGDVSVWPSRTSGRPVVCLALSSPSGRALFEVPLAALVEFLANSYAAVPTGCESDHIDLDEEIAALLAASPDG